MENFSHFVSAQSGDSLRRGTLETLQLNLGKKCNQACRHCHVDAAPWRTEEMDSSTAEKIIAWIRRHRPFTVDITGGAPELNPSFRRLVEESRKCGCRVIDRNNLTILSEPGFEDLPAFLATHDVEVIASLPCYSVENVTRQRGQGVFERSITGLRKLNEHGYGDRLPLHLVYNPVGAQLPPSQVELEADYKETLLREFGIKFNHLLTLTNQPIARFAEDLRKTNQWDAYLSLLVQNFNPATLPGLMCRNTLSVSYTGELFDCDFNQMLDLKLEGRPQFLWDLDPDATQGVEIRTGPHCFACTAGAGSSCGGSLVTSE